MTHVGLGRWGQSRAEPVAAVEPKRTYFMISTNWVLSFFLVFWLNDIGHRLLEIALPKRIDACIVVPSGEKLYFHTTLHAIIRYQFQLELKTSPLVCEMSNIYFTIVSTSGFQIIWDAGLFGGLNTAALGTPK